MVQLNYRLKEAMVESDYLWETLNQLPPMESDPPFQVTYKTLFIHNSMKQEEEEKEEEEAETKNDVVLNNKHEHLIDHHFIVEECELPVIDLRRLNLGELEREKCKEEISRASQEWGFFQVVNHGISREILERMRREQIEVFKKPFQVKKSEKYMNFSAGSYRWGTPSATCLRQLSWSEAFHIPLTDISASAAGFSCLSSIMEQFATTVADLAQRLAEILAEKLGHKSTFFKEHCLPSTCFLRMNRYPPCPISSEVYGLMPHTDSDFLTILHQDQIGGLQLVKDGKWIAVRPNPEALIINIGDLFQAWSNDVYKSVEHRVVTNQHEERFSTAYFLCPKYDTVIQSCGKPSIYRKFSFREYRQRVQEDVQKLGHKVGLPRFLV